jgi:Recombinase/Recombinase zinc beta ribbon domain
MLRAEAKLVDYETCYKGQISELELHTLRSRLTAGLLQKAQRGELALMLPVGLVRDADGGVRKEPDREVQDRLALLFGSFLRLRSIAQVVRFFRAEQLLLPRRDRFGDVLWRPATLSAVTLILKNPAYAGAFVYGRTRTLPPQAGQPPGRRKQPLPVEQWKIRIPDRYPAYIDWQTYEKIQAMIRDNHSDYAQRQTRGVPRCGLALVHGLVYCGACGHKLRVRYKPRPRYQCRALHEHQQAPLCQNLLAAPIDREVVGQFFEALKPLELDAYEQARAQLAQQQAQTAQAHRQQVERLRYQAQLAERQFRRIDPDNRLVAAELEKRWEEALRQLRQAEEASPPPPAPQEVPPELRQLFTEAGQALPKLWQEDRLLPAQKKALLRCLIDKVVVRRSAVDTIHLRIIWKGGAVTERDIAVPVLAIAQLPFAKEMARAIATLARQGKTDTEIAATLTQRGYHSPRHAMVLPTTVQRLRLRQGVVIHRKQAHPSRVPGFLSVSQVAARLAIPEHWIHDRIYNGTIRVARHRVHRLYLFPDAPKTLSLFRQLRKGQIQSVRF